ncbi:flavin reductase family protein [Basilea psittacipulmonis]|uniref:Flavin reductase like domain-containing protein n=1 Tax=Basilea psittacipulmonis DSM 24701 TaxID=1072685 RepID=A0A077DJ93_9BURK|nr:flavin reductase family protein [Basilea psittacipulmonis]AIL33178.1 hypothetical protein IX83_07620 [Basilea psittacipulmonis DSM 24701]
MNDHQALKKAFARFPTGVAIVTIYHPETQKSYGMTLSSFASVSLEPALVSWCLSKKSQLVPLIQERIPYRLHILSSSQESLAKKFATGSQEERFAGVDLNLNPPFLDIDSQHTAAWFNCEHEVCLDTGDHYLLVSKVQAFGYQEKKPLIFHGSRLLTEPYVF